MSNLGDNIFQMKIKTLADCEDVDGGIVFGYHVNDPERYGVVEFDENFKVLSLEETTSLPNQTIQFLVILLRQFSFRN